MQDKIILSFIQNAYAPGTYKLNRFTIVDSFTKGQVNYLITYILSNSNLNLVQSREFKKKPKRNLKQAKSA